MAAARRRVASSTRPTQLPVASLANAASSRKATMVAAELLEVEGGGRELPVVGEDALVHHDDKERAKTVKAGGEQLQKQRRRFVRHPRPGLIPLWLPVFPTAIPSLGLPLTRRGTRHTGGREEGGDERGGCKHTYLRRGSTFHFRLCLIIIIIMNYYYFCFVY